MALVWFGVEPWLVLHTSHLFLLHFDVLLHGNFDGLSYFFVWYSFLRDFCKLYVYLLWLDWIQTHYLDSVGLNEYKYKYRASTVVGTKGVHLDWCLMGHTFKQARAKSQIWSLLQYHCYFLCVVPPPGFSCWGHTNFGFKSKYGYRYEYLQAQKLALHHTLTNA